VGRLEIQPIAEADTPGSLTGSGAAAQEAVDCAMSLPKGTVKPAGSVPEAKNRYQHSIKWERIREQLTQTVERAQKGEKRSPVRMWEARR
jgi:hypothetical protein